MRPQLIKEVVNGASNGMSEVKLLTIGDECSILDHGVQLLIDSLNEVLSSCLEQEDLVVVVSVDGQVAALLTNELVVDDAEGHVRLVVVATHHVPVFRADPLQVLLLDQLLVSLVRADRVAVIVLHHVDIIDHTSLLAYLDLAWISVVDVFKRLRHMD